VRPTLPEWLPDLELTNLVGEATVDLRFWREDTKTDGKSLTQMVSLVYTDDSEANGTEF